MGRISGLLAATLWISVQGSTAAQELRIYTVTKDVTQQTADPAGKAVVVARSLTLFHAGKVYDYIDSLREVTIYESAHRRFTVLNETAATYSVVSQDEIRRFLSLAEERARELAGDLVRSSSPGERQSLEMLQFQLRPEFDVNFESAARRLVLKSPQFGYEVVCAEPPQPVIIDSYLRYADAIAELNSVLHPQSLLPGPRMQLNRRLRERSMLPVTVRRRCDFGQTHELVAEHEWKWELTELDRQLIDLWESHLAKGALKELPFEQMQRAVLTGGLTSK